jgi:hypothetical protein
MIDLFNIPNSQDNASIFYANGSAWQTWRKPRKCNYVWMMAIGGGGGGGGGLTVSFSNLALGGGSGAVTRAMFNSSNIPDILYIQVGLGGTGGTPNNSGTAGSRSFISLSSNTITTNVIMASGSAGALGGTPGAGAAVSGEIDFTRSVGNFITLSTFISTLGVSTPSAPATTDITPLTSQITCPGAGGAGLVAISPQSFIQSSSINATLLSPRISGGTSFTGSTNGTNGGDGYTSWKPFFSTGGAGGGATYSGTSGNGGIGGIGSGGGAGGSAYSTVGGVAGNGGKGGDGLVIITTF